jgi:ribosome-associated protein
MAEFINIAKELLFITSRSGGKGGQNVNKVETKVEARWHVANTKLFSLEQIDLINKKLGKKINELGFLQVTASIERTQIANKAIAIEKINKLVNVAIIVPIKRKATKIPKAIIEKRLNDKKKVGQKKELRKGI